MRYENKNVEYAKCSKIFNGSEANLKKMLICCDSTTHPKQALPPKSYCLSENLFIIIYFFSNSVNKPFFKSLKAVF